MKANPQTICQTLVQNRWLSRPRATESLALYQSLGDNVSFVEMLLQFGYINQAQYQKLRQFTSNSTISAEDQRDKTVLPTLRGNYQKYQVVREIGRGGMGKVFLAKDLDLKRMVAIKVCQKIAPQDLLRFIREAQIGSQLEHPGIAPIYDAGQTPQRNIYFAMKYIEGISLAQIIRELAQSTPHILLRYPLRKRLVIFSKILEAISYVHARAVIHRDLKPDNIMLGPFGEVLVVDWGLAKPLKEVEETPAPSRGDFQSLEAAIQAKTMSGAVVGTPGYMSPEQALGERNKLSTQSDIYALGVILYELLALRPAFVGKEVMQVLMMIVEGNWLPPSRAAPEQKIPKGLERVVQKAMALSPTERYPSCKAMLDDVQAYLDDQPLSVYRPPMWERAGKFIQNHSGVLLVFCMVFLLLSGFFYFMSAAAQAGRAKAESQKKKVLAAKKILEAQKARAEADKAKAEADKAKAEADKKKVKAEADAKRKFFNKRNEAMAPYLVAKNLLYQRMRFPLLKNWVIPNLKKALKIQPQFVEARMELMKVLFYLERGQEAIGQAALLFQYLPKGDKDKLGPYLQKIMFAFVNKTSEKKISLQLPSPAKILELKPKFLVEEYWQAIWAFLYTTMKNYKTALEIIEQLLQTPRGQSWEIYYLKASMLKYQKRNKEALALVEELSKKYPNNLLFNLLKGEILRQQKKFKGALNTFRKVWLQDPENHLLWKKMARLFGDWAWQTLGRDRGEYLAQVLASHRYLKRYFLIEGKLKSSDFRGHLTRITGDYVQSHQGIKLNARLVYTPEIMRWLSSKTLTEKSLTLKREFALFIWEIIQLPRQKKWLSYVCDDLKLPASYFSTLARQAKKYLPQAKKYLQFYQKRRLLSLDRRYIFKVLKQME